MAEVNYVFATGIRDGKPTGIISQFNPEFEVGERFYVFAMMQNFEGDFQMVMTAELSDGARIRVIDDVPPASWLWYNSNAWFEIRTAGNHSITFESSRFGGFQMPFRIKAEPEEPPQEETGIFGFTSDPTGAAIFVDQDQVGFTPVNVEREARSFHVVSVTLPGYKTITQTIRWPRLQTIPVFYQMHLEDPPEEEEETLWDRIKGFLGDTLSKINDFLQNPPIGNFFATFDNLIVSVMNKLGISQDSILRYQTDLDPNEAFKWLIFAPLMGTAAASTSLKTLFPTATPAEIQTLVGKFGARETVLSLEKYMLANPLKAGTQWTKLPLEIKNAVGGRLLDSPGGREVFFILNERAATAIPTNLITAAKVRAFPKWFKLIAGSLAGYVTFANFLAWIGKEAVKESLSFPIWTLIDDGDFAGALEHIDALDESINLYEESILLTRVIPLVKDIWIRAIENARVEAGILRKRAEDGLAGITPPEEGINITDLNAFPPVTQIGNSVTLSSKIASLSEEQIEIDVIYEIKKDGNLISFGGEDNLIISKFLPLDSSFIWPTENREAGFYDVDVTVTNAATSASLDQKTFSRAFQLTEDEVIAEGPGTLSLSVSPEDAEIQVEGQPQINSPGEYELEAGSYSIVVSSEGFRRKIRDFFIRSGEPTVVSIILIRPEEARLLIQGKPEDTKIEVIGRPEITAQGEFVLPSGTYDVKASKDGFTSSQRTFFLDEGDEKVFSFNLQKVDTEEPKGAITINTNPQGAKVSVDGVFQFDVTPLTVFESEGEHLVRMTLEDFEPLEKSLTWENNARKEETFDLSPLPPSISETPARLFITSDPSFANVSINGVSQFASTPFTVFLEKGTYIIRVKEGDLPAAEKEIILQSGDVKTMHFILTTVAPQPTPSIITVTPEEAPTFDFTLLDPPVTALVPLTDIPPIIENELLINIETTDIFPWKGRIYSIAMLELNKPENLPLVLVNNNEAALIEQFSDLFSAGEFTKLVGFKTTFDHRFIFAKMMLYRIKNKAFVDVEMRDVKQIMDQVKEEFVYFPSKKGTLNDWGKHLFGVGKFGSQETILREYIAGNFAYVEAFQTRQIEITANLYALARFVASESPQTSFNNVPVEESTPQTSHIPQTPSTTQTKTCKKCLQVNPFDNQQCIVCGDKF